MAKPLPADSNSTNDTLRFGRWDAAFKNAEVILASKGSGITEIKKSMLRWGDGARAEIRVKWKGLGGGHVFAVENVGGRIQFTDPQCGLQGVSVEEYFKHAHSGLTAYARIDTLAPSELILVCVEART